MAVSYGFRYLVSDQAELGRPHLGLPPRVLSPLPLFLVKPCGRRGIKKPVFISLTHFPSCNRPPRAGPATSANHNPTWLGLEINLVKKLGLL
jgi:hypothetical protein